MSQSVTLMARDGHVFDAYLAKPDGTARGGVVVLQEIFGLTSFVREAANGFASQGYLAIAPALFDRVRRGIVLGYSPDEVQLGLGYRKQVADAKALLDIGAAASVVRHAGKIAVVGFCWGGRLAWLCAVQTQLDAAVSYYGGGIGQDLAKTPACPMLLHYGDTDASIPQEEVERTRAAFPSGVFHVYPDAGHAFANPDRPANYHAGSATLAHRYTSEFLLQHIG